MSKSIVVQFKNVSKNFKNRKIYDKVSFSIHQGELVGIIGPSGAGKSTLFRMILGMSEPDEGEVIVGGFESDFGKVVGFASQEYSFYPELKLDENLRYFGMMYNIPKATLEPRIQELLELVELDQARHTKAKNISGGMKRRLDLALALISDPNVLILDEPTTGLDIVLKEAIWRVISKINKSGKTILVSSHDIAEIQKFCPSILFIKNGKVLTKQDLQKKINTHRVKNLENLFRRLVDVS